MWIWSYVVNSAINLIFCTRLCCHSLNSDWWHNHSSKTGQAGHANDSLTSMGKTPMIAMPWQWWLFLRTRVKNNVTRQPIGIMAYSQRKPGWDKILPLLDYKMIFIVQIKILFAVLFVSRLWPSADVQPILNDLGHAMPCQCIFVISMCKL